ncbi:histidinol-phosphate aminotransferase [Methylohalomonas lacus]|uniref:Histidinol-phosphate aminotransferase n=1 Tax=Methylohalomonas lacus TaxID=398773 RepID=A0AAE3L0V5_9GAMM|nr:histidinol-phosphate transaminase [Methylohalomonas lacus]MCS3902231.1 histidinol-phosphate aminotransferase [Methylohalomonas lacus]
MMNDRLQRIIRPQTLAASAYQVHDAGDRIKLDAMENPYPVPAALRAELASLLSAAPLNRYPDPQARRLKARIRASFGLAADQPLLLGNGSDELIQIIAQAVAGPDVTLLAPEPGFAMYRLIAAATGSRYAGVDLNAADFSLDIDAMLAAIERERPAVVFLAWPNNPTGNRFDLNAVRRVIEAAPGIVVIDEAYHAFAGNSCVDLLAEYAHLIVLRTLSKLGLAGLRIGFMAAAGDWIEQFDKQRLPYNLGTLNQLAADAILARHELLDEQVAAILAERERLHTALQALSGVQVWPSDANFLLFRVTDADRVYAGLLERGVLIKKLHGSHALLDNCLRVTVGTPEENDAFLEALRTSL